MEKLEFVKQNWKWFALGAVVLFVLLGITFGDVPEWPQ